MQFILGIVGVVFGAMIGNFWGAVILGAEDVPEGGDYTFVVGRGDEEGIEIRAVDLGA